MTLPAFKHYTVDELQEHEETGFDRMMAKKNKDLMTVYKLIKANPGMTRAEIGEKTGLSKRTISRYFSIIRKSKKAGGMVSQLDVLVADKEKRLESLKKLAASEPSLSRSELSKRLGVSQVKLGFYLKELRERTRAALVEQV